MVVVIGASLGATVFKFGGQIFETVSVVGEFFGMGEGSVLQTG